MQLEMMLLVTNNFRKEVKIIRKVLIPLVMLLTFSMLSTSVSATEFYKVHLIGHAIGDCNVSGDVDGLNYPGEGRLHLEGFAIAVHGIGLYEVFPEFDPGVHIRMGIHMKVRWENKKLIANIRSSNKSSGVLSGWWLDIDDLQFRGHYIEDENLHFISGTAFLHFKKSHLGYTVGKVVLNIDSTPSMSIDVIWNGDNAGTWVRHRVWPPPAPPAPPQP